MKGRERQPGGGASAEAWRTKNRQRLGGNGGGLSLMSFANAKSKQSGYNPAMIKKQREFYKNAKMYKKYKKLVRNRNKPEGTNLLNESGQDINEISNYYESSASTSRQNPKKPKKDTRLESLREELEQKQKEKERERKERERAILAKKEEREKAEAARKARKQKMSKRTTSGQPIMRYRIENILQSLKNENT